MPLDLHCCLPFFSNNCSRHKQPLPMCCGIIVCIFNTQRLTNFEFVQWISECISILNSDNVIHTMCFILKNYLVILIITKQLGRTHRFGHTFGFEVNMNPFKLKFSHFFVLFFFHVLALCLYRWAEAPSTIVFSSPFVLLFTVFCAIVNRFIQRMCSLA